MSLKDKIKKDEIPVHIAIIMDGNGRWAKKRGFIRTKGHTKGVDAVRDTVEAAAELGVKYLTLYAFSTENWNRPKYEIDALMTLLVKSVNKERKTFMDNNIQLQAIGDMGSLPEKSHHELLKAIEYTSHNTGLMLILALSYSSRWEIIEAVRKNISVPLAVGGGIRNKKEVEEIFKAGANLIILGNGGEKNPDLLSDACYIRDIVRKL